MTIEEIKELHARAKNKKDGIYYFRGNMWAVKDGKFIAFVNQKNELLLRSGYFNSYMGKLKGEYEKDRKKEFKTWLSKQ